MIKNQAFKKKVLLIQNLKKKNRVKKQVLRAVRKNKTKLQINSFKRDKIEDLLTLWLILLITFQTQEVIVFRVLKMS